MYVFEFVYYGFTFMIRYANLKSGDVRMIKLIIKKLSLCSNIQLTSNGIGYGKGGVQSILTFRPIIRFELCAILFDILKRYVNVALMNDSTPHGPHVR
jgi:hypothetical protein